MIFEKKILKIKKQTNIKFNFWEEYVKKEKNMSKKV